MIGNFFVGFSESRWKTWNFRKKSFKWLHFIKSRWFSQNLMSNHCLHKSAYSLKLSYIKVTFKGTGLFFRLLPVRKIMLR